MASKAGSKAARAAASAATRQFSAVMRQRLEVPIEKTNVSNVFKYSDGLRYRIAAAAIVERSPIIVPDLPSWLTDYHDFKIARDEALTRGNGEPILDPLQILNQQTSSGKGGKDQGKKKPNVKQQAGQPGKAAAPVRTVSVEELDEFGDPTFDPTTVDLALFKPAPRTTDADAKNDVRSTQRALGSSLFLTVKKPRSEFAWGFPQGGYDAEKDGDQLRNTAQRELAEECGANLRVYFYGNAPLFHIEYRFESEAIRKMYDADGAKVFFYPAIYLGGDIELQKSELEDYQWMKLEEVVANLAPSVAKLSQKVFFDPYLHTSGSLGAKHVTPLFTD